MKCNVLCIQTQPILCDRDANLSNMTQLLEAGLEEHPKTNLVVFPELAVSGYECDEEFKNLAEPCNMTSKSIKTFADLAVKNNIFIIFGMPECDVDTSLIYNSQILIDNKGEIVGSYRKVHLFDGEKRWFEAGDKFSVFETEIGKIGLLICYDSSFPEVSRILALKGADLLVNSTNWEKPYCTDMELMMSARAFENAIPFVCCNRIGFDKTLGFFGHSRILDAQGNPVCAITDEIEGYIYASIDFERTKKHRRDYYTMLDERRPDLYKEILDL